MNSILSIAMFVSTIFAPLSGTIEKGADKIFDGSFKVVYKKTGKVEILATPQIKIKEGREGSLVVDDQDYKVTIKVRVQDSNQGRTALVTLQIEEDKKLISSPQMLVQLGEKGSCQIGTAKEYVRIEALVK